MKLSNAITDEEYRQKKAQFLKEKEDIKEKLNDVDHRSDSWMKTVEDTFDLAQRARHQFKYASKEEKRTLLSEIGSNLKLFNKIVHFDSEKPFEVVMDAKKLEPKTDARFEPDKSPYTKPQLEQFFASNPLLLPNSSIIISALEKIVKAFEVTIQIDLIRQRWEEIKKLQVNRALA